MRKLVFVLLIIISHLSFSQSLKDRIQGDWVCTKVVDSEGNPTFGKFGQSDRYLRFAFSKKQFTISQSPFDKGMTFPQDIEFKNGNSIDCFPIAKYDLQERIYHVKELDEKKMILATLGRRGDSIYYHFENQKQWEVHPNDTIDNGTIFIKHMKWRRGNSVNTNKLEEYQITTDPVYLSSRPLYEGTFGTDLAHIKLPNNFKMDEFSPELVLEFNVSEIGAENYKIVKGFDEEINQEILSIVEKNHKQWDPVMINGIPIKTTMKFHLRFISSFSEIKIPWPESNESLGKKLSQLLQEGKYEQSVNFIDELIRRDPNNKGLYQLRITINKRLNRNDLIVRDAIKLQSLNSGITLEEPVNTYDGKEAKEDSLAQNPLTKAEKMPEFPGGEPALMNFIKNNLKYPVLAAEAKIQGTVIVNYVIGRDGKIRNPKVISSPDDLLSNEALRILRVMPDWMPGIQDGKPVPVSYTIPFKFISR